MNLENELKFSKEELQTTQENVQTLKESLEKMQKSIDKYADQLRLGWKKFENKKNIYTALSPNLFPCRALIKL